MNGKPQCEQTVYCHGRLSGYLFTIEAVAVGGDFGTTYETINSNLSIWMD